MKNLLKSIFILFGTVAILTLATNSYFSSQVQISGNQFTAGEWEIAPSPTPSISPTPPESEKVKICHATAAFANPYVLLEVDWHAAFGDTGNDNGQGDHSTHIGPVFDLQTMKQGDNWGDIIPPHHNFSGLNWVEGQVIWENSCQAVTADLITEKSLPMPRHLP